MEFNNQTDVKKLNSELIELESKRLSVFLFSVLLGFGALGLFVLSIYVFREYYEPNQNIFDHGNFSRVWSPMFALIVVGIKLFYEAIQNIRVYVVKVNRIKEKKNKL